MSISPSDAIQTIFTLDELLKVTNQKHKVETDRLRRKIARKDAKLAGQQRKIQKLESDLAWTKADMPQDIAGIFERTLSNIRMVPMIGINRNDRILEIRTEIARK